MIKQMSDVLKDTNYSISLLSSLSLIIQRKTYALK